MKTLFPIIRRVRRPLLVHDAPPVVVANVEPADAAAADPAEIKIPAPQPSVNDAQISEHNES